MKLSIGRNVLLIASLLLGIIGAGVLPAYAAGGPAISYPTRGGSSNLGGYTFGWEFTTDTNVWITHLGMWDQGADGNQIAHDIGIWDLSSNLLVSGTLQTNDLSITSLGGDPTPGIAGGIYRYTDIPDYFLPAGTYRIGGYIGGNVAGGGSSTPDGWHQAPIGMVVAPHIILGNAYDNNLNTSLAFPYRDGGATPYAGPNFLFEIPEPSAFALFVTGGGWFFLRRRTNRRSGR